MTDTDPMETPPPLAGLDPADLLRQGAADDTVVDGVSRAFQPPVIEEIAATFPQFEILELIGQGGMGAVYKVRQKDLDRIVALKILPPAIGQSPEFSDRFTREARALAKLNHPGIVTLHEFGQQDGLYFILMEFVDGVNLAQLMKTGRVSPREALAIVPQICDALQYAHDQGVVHRDIKPENLLLDRQGRVKVADFGIAKVVAAVCDLRTNENDEVRRSQTDATLAGKIIGTPQYMAPEQIEHPSDVDHRADIYALGVVLYQMLTGELPGKDLQAPSRKLQIDVRLDEIVLKAMEKNPEMRYQTAVEFRTILETVGPADSQSSGTSITSSQTSSNSGKRVSIGRLIAACVIFGTLMALREEFHSIWHRSAIAALAAALGLLVGFPRHGFGVDQTSTTNGKKPSSRRAKKAGWIAAAFVVTGVLWLILRDGGKAYPTSSTSSAFKAPVMGRIEFRYSHPDSTGGGATSYPVKRWGDTQWRPSSGNTIGLKGGRSLLFKTRVDAMRSDSPVAMVTTSSDNSNWETKALKIDGKDALRQLEFSNGLRVEIHWSPVDSSKNQSNAPDPTQQAVMLRASRESDRMHPIKVDEATLIAPPALRFIGLQYPGKERWHPDGSPVTDPRELDLMREIGPVYAGDMSKGESIRGMEFWFSHPLLESWHTTEIEFLDDAGVVTTRLGGINGMMKETIGAEGRLQWSLKTTPVDISKPLNVQLSYTIGPLERVQEHIVEPNASGSSFSDGRTRVASVGQTAGGRAFLALSVDDATQGKHRYGVEAVTKDGAIIQGSWWSNGIITFEFDVPIGEVAKFRIGTRPLKSVVWKNVAVAAMGKVQASRESDRMHPVYPDAGLSEKTSGMPNGKKLADYVWDDTAANGRIGDRVPQTLDGRTVLKIENLKNEPLQAHLRTIEKPPISATNYALSGEIRYESVKGPAYLEMWSVFPNGRFFSRTLGDPGSGPMGQLTGTSGWREFLLPFDRTGTANAPSRIEVNLYLPGPGVVFVGPLRLVELGAEEVAESLLESRCEERNEEPKPQAGEAAEMAKAWLKKIDAGDYKQSWKDAAEFFQKAITEEGWADAMTKARKPLGAVKSRKLLDAKNAKSLPGAPDGEYVVMQFESTFDEKEKAVEIVTFMTEADGTWKAAGYFIR